MTRKQIIIISIVLAVVFLGVLTLILADTKKDTKEPVKPSESQNLASEEVIEEELEANLGADSKVELSASLILNERDRIIENVLINEVTLEDVTNIEEVKNDINLYLAKKLGQCKALKSGSCKFTKKKIKDKLKEINDTIELKVLDPTIYKEVKLDIKRL